MFANISIIAGIIEQKQQIIFLPLEVRHNSMSALAVEGRLRICRGANRNTDKVTENDKIYWEKPQEILKSEIKGFSVRNMQCMMQFFNEYNQELTKVKGAVSSITQPPAVAQADKYSKPITKSVISQLDRYNFTLPVKQTLSSCRNI